MAQTRVVTAVVTSSWNSRDISGRDISAVSDIDDYGPNAIA